VINRELPRWRKAYLAVAIGAGLAGCNGASVGSAPAGDQTELKRLVASLEQRKTALQDVNDIKRLQAAYGYYVDAAMWDQVADLFAENGTLEYGLDGVYRGKSRVREYFYALGGGKSGLSPGQVSEHFQVMPVIDLAPDGRSAKGTWRSVGLTGQVGRDAFWSEGPFENEYVKENGVWKIGTLHWYQTLMVPYDGGGWARQKDVNGGKYVSGSLPPDAPTTVAYKTWPSGFVPPFHFIGKLPGPLAATASPVTAGDDGPVSSRALRQRAAALARAVELLDDQRQIENLQRIYGYYIDKDMWRQAADLFADDAELEVAGRGAYVGKARVLAYLQGIGPEGPQEGRLFDNMQLQQVVSVDPQGRTAKARWHLFAQFAESKKFHEWGAGVYENGYVKQGGVWKIRRLHLYPSMYAPYGEGWGKVVRPLSSFEPDLRPDRADRQTRGGTRVAPFDYQNPVTSPLKHERIPSGSPDLSGENATAMFGELDHRLGLLEDAAQIENVQGMYGYYLATFEWDALTDLFAPDGTIEIALRGVYVGKASVRRNLNLYGQQGLDDGVLHNHMQYQPVIDVSDDRRTARIRSRAFSMMGEFGKGGLWMGGVYENELVKIDGVWRIKRDQVMNTYFAPYDIGWKDLALRPAPGVTAANPPDLPPSIHFEMYPRPFLPPYHYDNPVSGRAAKAP
jgi:SnoaL-like domain